MTSSDSTSHITHLEQDRSGELDNFQVKIHTAPSYENQDCNYIWMGFRHFWKRSILGTKLPHRIQGISNYIVPNFSKINGKWQDNTTITLGQKNVVDGNYMRPKSYYRKLVNPHLKYHHGSIHLSWEDSIDTSNYPKGKSRIRLRVLIPQDQLAIPMKDSDIYTIILRGFDLGSSDTSNFDLSKRRTDGFWPYRIFFKLDDITKTDEGLSLVVKSDIFRSWTPFRGGLPYLFEQPLSQSLHFDLHLYFTIIAGCSSKLSTVSRSTRMKGMAKNETPKVSNILTSVPPEDFQYTVTGISGFGFELKSYSSSHGYLNHLGRYLGGIQFQIKDDEPEINDRSNLISSQVWVPRTVKNTGVVYFMETTTIHMAGEDIELGKQKQVDTCICINSDESAAFFSYWKKCRGMRGCSQKYFRTIELE